MGRPSKYIENCNGSHFDRNDVLEMARNMNKRVHKAAERGITISYDGFGRMTEHLCSIITSNCPLCGTKMDRNYEGAHQTNISPTCDRIYPEKGYTVGNVQVICHMCNLTKDQRNPYQFWHLVVNQASYMPKDFQDALLAKLDK